MKGVIEIDCYFTQCRTWKPIFLFCAFSSFKAVKSEIVSKWYWKFKGQNAHYKKVHETFKWHLKVTVFYKEYTLKMLTLNGVIF